MEDVVRVKEEVVEASTSGRCQPAPPLKKVSASKQLPTAVIQLSSSSSSSSSESDSDSDHNVSAFFKSRDSDAKRRKFEAAVDVVFPVGFLASLPPPSHTPPVVASAAADQPPTRTESVSWSGQSCKQFWKAGDYVGASSSSKRDIPSGGMDHVRVHPKFLHSNATSHKWALGAFAELLDNALDEHGNGATFVNVEMIENKKDKSKMLLLEDNGGGMDPDKMRQCMSLGYSAKSQVANTIGQYGNGFKTSTMRLGADVIVFSRCPGQKGKSPTQSIGLLSYTFLRSTGKEDTVVPMLDYERKGKDWKKMIRCAAGDWNINIEAMVQWSPFSSEADLLQQFNHMPDHGTRIIVYNLWEDDQGLLELDFDSDPHDIQLRGVNRDVKNIEMAKQFPNSKHFLTYRHSLRSYASILYLRLPPRFRIILRGKDVEHHNIVNDMMLSENVTYRPQSAADTSLKDANMTAVVTIGFVKDAKHHMDVQGFNVYHKNRLIKPFWRVWNAAGSDGRGVIGLLEANFVEPAHDKQGFERTTVLARLEARLVQMQKTYWSTNCHKIGYAPRRNKKVVNDAADREASPDFNINSSSSGAKLTSLSSKRSTSKTSWHGNGQKKARKGTYPEPSSTSEDESDDDMHTVRRGNGISQKKPAAKKYPTKDGLPATQLPSHSEDSESQKDCMSEGANGCPVTKSRSKVGALALLVSDSLIVNDLRRENRELKKRLERWEGETPGVVMHNRSRCEACESLEPQLQEAQHKVEQLSNEQESLIQLFAEERGQREKEEDNLRKKLKDASNTIQELLEKVRLLEKMKTSKLKADR